MERVEIKDKSGRVICSGDIVQHRLGKYGKKSGGPSNHKILRHKNDLYVYDIKGDEWQKSYKLDQIRADYMVIIDTSEREE